MAFPCTNAEVKIICPQWTITDDTTVTSAAITQYINNSAALIRGILRICEIDEDDLDTNGTAWLNYTNQLGAACQLERSAVGRAMEMTDRARDFCAEFESRLSELKSNPGLISSDDIISEGIKSEGRDPEDYFEIDYEW